jgi:hypothetical protein
MSFGHLTNNLLHPIFCLHFYVNPIKLKLINVSKFFFFFLWGAGRGGDRATPGLLLKRRQDGSPCPLRDGRWEWLHTHIGGGRVEDPSLLKWWGGATPHLPYTRVDLHPQPFCGGEFCFSQTPPFVNAY